MVDILNILSEAVLSSDYPMCHVIALYTVLVDGGGEISIHLYGYWALGAVDPIDANVSDICIKIPLLC